MPLSFEFKTDFGSHDLCVEYDSTYAPNGVTVRFEGPNGTVSAGGISLDTLHEFVYMCRKLLRIAQYEEISNEDDDDD